jgi:UDP-N-acetylmuramoyl-L-alanyl-D-glutamate--2,6-diaminopimelate ligase
MLLSKLTADIEGLLDSNQVDPEIKRVTHDSREVIEGDIFCCLRGKTTDGHNYIQEAIDSGASALLAEKVSGLDIPTFLVENVRAVLPLVASRIVGDPSKEINVVGITGTNGKTSVVSMLAEILSTYGTPTATIGTLTGMLTTPESPELQRELRKYCSEGVEVVAMEVSSHSLVQKRVSKTHFSSVAFTNLSHDHLDFHGTMEDYYLAKGLLFSGEFSKRGVIATDSDYGRSYFEKAISSGMEVEELSLKNRNVVFTQKSSSFDWRGERVTIPLGGPFAYSNALVSAEIAIQLGLEVAEVIAGLNSLNGVPGRFEPVSLTQESSAIIDYAHTPSALAELLGGCRKIVAGRIILVFGCGGERDSEKRPLMGEVASVGADVNILTSDNPRGEDAEKIISEIASGMSIKPRVIEVDRRKAIEQAFNEAESGDLIVVAGRGHEEYQEIDGKKIPFSDKNVLLDVVSKASSSGER